MIISFFVYLIIFSTLYSYSTSLSFLCYSPPLRYPLYVFYYLWLSSSHLYRRNQNTNFSKNLWKI